MTYVTGDSSNIAWLITPSFDLDAVLLGISGSTSTILKAITIFVYSVYSVYNYKFNGI